jgi:DNA-binding CsgD family transcriptional regulator
MPKGPKPAELTLSEEEQTRLEALVHRHSTPQQLAKRGRMVLLAAQGKSNAEIARGLGVNVDTVRLWRRRWIDTQTVPCTELSVAERLTDAPRPGKPSQITAEQRCLMIALACEQPQERPLSHWTGREIAEEMMQRGIIKYISPRHASRLLKKGTSDLI